MCDSTSESHLSQPKAATMEGSALPPENTRSAVLAHEAIARRAYDIYIRNGRPVGHCLQHWKQAEQELRDEESAAFDEQDTVFEESPIQRHEDYRANENRISDARSWKHTGLSVNRRFAALHQSSNTGVPY